jgi:HAD superfamily hydrolase (TIGR01484 family)
VIRLVSLDLDGTIVTGVGALPSERVRKAIKAAQAKGAMVTFCTGRWIMHARELAQILQINAPGAFQDGCQVYDFSSARILHEEIIDPSLVSELESLSGRTGRGQFAVRSSERIYTRGSVPDPEYWTQWLAETKPVELGPGKRYPTEVSQVLLVAPDASGMHEYAEKAREVAGKWVRVWESFGRVVDIDPAHGDKGKGLAWLAGHLGIAREEVLALDDSDPTPIRWAGVGVAMGTAPEAVKAEADWVAPGVAEDGAAAAIERFVLS